MIGEQGEIPVSDSVTATDELKLIQDTYMRVWQNLVVWFTWFININVLALGWIVSAQNALHLVKPFAVVMVLLCILGSISLVVIYRYSKSSVEDARRIKISDQKLLRSIVPTPLTNSVCLAMILTIVAVGCMWVVVYSSN
jgi:hypothetical protein